MCVRRQVRRASSARRPGRGGRSSSPGPRDPTPPALQSTAQQNHPEPASADHPRTRPGGASTRLLLRATRHVGPSVRDLRKRDPQPRNLRVLQGCRFWSRLCFLYCYFSRGRLPLRSGGLSGRGPSRGDPSPLQSIRTLGGLGERRPGHRFDSRSLLL